MQLLFHSVAVISSPPNDTRSDGFKSEVAEGVATGGAAEKRHDRDLVSRAR